MLLGAWWLREATECTPRGCPGNSQILRDGRDALAEWAAYSSLSRIKAIRPVGSVAP